MAGLGNSSLEMIRYASSASWLNSFFFVLVGQVFLKVQDVPYGCDSELHDKLLTIY